MPSGHSRERTRSDGKLISQNESPVDFQTNEPSFAEFYDTSNSR